MAVGDSIQVTEGSGKRLATGATYTENAQTVRDEKIILGEPYLADVIVTAAPSLATANSHLIQIMAGSSNKLRIRRIEVFPYTAATTVTLTALQLFRLTTAGTGGSAATVSALDPTDTAGLAAMVLPTVKGTEAASPVWQGSFTAWQSAPTDGVLPPPLVIDFDYLRMKPLMIAAGTSNGLALKNLTAIAAAACILNVYLTETPF